MTAFHPHRERDCLSKPAIPRPLKCAASLGLLASAWLAQPASAQVLFGLDTGAGGAPPVQIHALQMGACAVVGSCIPIDMAGGMIGMRWGLPTTPGGGVALDEATSERWLTPGPTLHRIDAACGHLDQWNVLGVLPPAPYFAVPEQLAWTGLALSRVPGKLFFTDYGRIAELDLPAPGSGGGALPVVGLNFMDGPAPLVYPLTGVDYDPIDDTLWVIDGAYNLVHIGRPGSGVGVLAAFNVAAMFPAAPVALCEGVAIDIFTTPAGFPRGVIAVTDGSNQILRLTTTGVPLAGCALGGLPRPLVGLEWPMPKPQIYCAGKVNSCGSTPAMQFSGMPSASATSGFLVRCVNAKANRTGMFLYGHSGRAAVPFGGGTLCLNAPISRITGLTTGGTGALCDGVLQVDVNAFAAGILGGTPKAYLTVPGELIQVQAWARDTLAAGSLLSDAMEYLVHP